MVIHAESGNEEKILNGVDVFDERYASEVLLGAHEVAIWVFVTDASAIACRCADRKDHEQPKMILIRCL
jgi:hypothetical protein